MINRLRTLARTVSPIALAIYDREDSASILRMISRELSWPKGEKDFTFEFWAAFPELRRWLGERKTQSVWAPGPIEGKIEKYEITLDMDRDDVDSARALVKASELANSIGEGFAAGKVMLAYGPLRDNALCYDGQNVYDTDHVHPNGKPYKNRFTIGPDLPDRGNYIEPTAIEVRRELKFAISMLHKNRLIRKTLVRTTNAIRDLVVITRSFATWSAFYDLQTEEEIDGSPNRYRGKFELLHDYDPPSGEEDSYDVIHAVPGGPRPTIFVRGREPNGLKFDTASEFRDANIPFGMDGRYGVATAFPQTTLRIGPLVMMATPEVPNV